MRFLTSVVPHALAWSGRCCGRRAAWQPGLWSLGRRSQPAAWGSPAETWQTPLWPAARDLPATTTHFHNPLACLNPNQQYLWELAGGGWG